MQHIWKKIACWENCSECLLPGLWQPVACSSPNVGSDFPAPWCGSNKLNLMTERQNSRGSMFPFSNSVQFWGYFTLPQLFPSLLKDPYETMLELGTAATSALPVVWLWDPAGATFRYQLDLSLLPHIHEQFQSSWNTMERFLEGINCHLTPGQAAHRTLKASQGLLFSPCNVWGVILHCCSLSKAPANSRSHKHQHICWSL